MYFKNIRTLEELRKKYRELAKKLHPDCGGSETEFKKMTAEYEQVFEQLKNSDTTSNKDKYNSDVDEAIREMINKIINLDVTIEICGYWLWISGNTFPVKEELKKLGFKWCKTKKVWAWHPGEYRKKSKKPLSQDEIRNYYGSQIVKKGSDTKKLK